MVQCILASGINRIKGKGKEFSTGLTAQNTKDIGRMTKHMEKEE